jgi:protein-S-isoprenylcysteine O-methyltransferase Ste14
VTKFIAWLGGAIFVASLALCAWWYLFPLGHVTRQAPLSGWRSVARDAALVTVFAVHHSLFARDRIKRQLSLIPPPLLGSFYVWIASVLLILVIAFWAPIGGELYEATGLGAAVHASVQLLGLWLISRAVAGIDPLELAGIRQVTSPPAQPHSRALQVTGPYRWVRHPLYLGWMLALFGAAHMTGDRLAFAGLTSLYLVVAVPWEEQSLRQSFGEDYARYADRVRWRVVPYVY